MEYRKYQDTFYIRMDRAMRLLKRSSWYVKQKEFTHVFSMA